MKKGCKRSGVAGGHAPGGSVVGYLSLGGSGYAMNFIKKMGIGRIR